MQSSSLLLYPIMELSVDKYTEDSYCGKIGLENKCIILQTKLLNVHNMRLIIDKKIFKLDTDCTYEFCNINKVNLFFRL